MAVAVLAAAAVGSPLVDEWVESSENPEELHIWLEDLRAHPLDLNRASVDEIAVLPLFDRVAARRLVTERRRAGGFSFPDQVESLRFLSRGQRQSLREFTVVLPQPRGAAQQDFRVAVTSVYPSDSRYDSDLLAGRFRASVCSPAGHTGFVYGVRRPEQVDLFEHVSAGLEFCGERGRPRICLGDYQMEFGTGLVFASSYGVAGWLSSPEQTSPGVARGLVSRPTSSRLAALRGAAVEWNTGRLGVTILGSHRRLSAAMAGEEADRLTEGESSSPELARARDDRVEESLVGISLRTPVRGGELGFGGVRAGYRPAFRESSGEDVRPRLAGSDLTGASVSVRIPMGPTQILSEVARSDPGGLAHQSALSFRAERLGWVLYHIHADADYQAPSSNRWGGFGGSAQNSNETGVRMHCLWSSHSLALQLATERSPFRTSTSPLRNSSSDLKARWTWLPVERVELGLTSERSWRERTSETEPAEDLRSDRVRFETVLHGRETYKIRLDLRSARRCDSRDHARSSLVYFQIRSRVARTDLFGRVTLFDVDPGAEAVRVYENSVWSAYPLASFSGTGRRAAVMLKRRFGPMRLGAKLDHTSMMSDNASRDSFGFALDAWIRS